MIYLDAIGFGKFYNIVLTYITWQFLDSPILRPGWKYNLNVIKDIKATTDFLSMEDKGCSIQPYDNCTTRIYVQNIIEECGGLPFSMKIGHPSAEVGFTNKKSGDT